MAVKFKRFIAKIIDYFIVFLLSVFIVAIIFSFLSAAKMAYDIQKNNPDITSEELQELKLSEEESKAKTEELLKNKKALFLLYILNFSVVVALVVFMSMIFGYSLYTSPGKWLLGLRIKPIGQKNYKLWKYILREPLLYYFIYGNIIRLISLKVEFFNAFIPAMSLILFTAYVLNVDIWNQKTGLIVIDEVKKKNKKD